jgi:succinyl-CoA synthetase beta subunit
MRLYEFQAKRIFAERGIPVPAGALLTSAEDVRELSLPAVLKVQIPVGGRGKAGGIRAVSSPAEARAVIDELLGAEIRGHTVQAILAEAQTEILGEYYLSVLLDKRTNRPMVMASAAGGVDIEQVARETPEKVIQQSLDPFLGLPSFVVRNLARKLGVADVHGFGAILTRLYEILWACDATLVEVNPLAQTPNGLMALDGKMLLDDKAAFRHAELFARLEEEQKGLDQTVRTQAEQLAEERDITYVLLDGDVGMIADGAGTGMLTLDLIQDAGGRAANFCEMGGLASPDVMCQSIEVVLANPKVKALLITLIGGLTRMDEMAEGIVQYLGKHESPVPMVIRMAGTQEEVGEAILNEIGIATYDDLPTAVQTVVNLAGGR